MSSFIPIFDRVFCLRPNPRSVFRWYGISSNIILIEGEEGFTFVDSGGISSRRQLLKACMQIELGKKGLISCIHTHGHIDHCGGDFLLLRRFQTRFWAADEAVPYIKSGSPLLFAYEKEFIITTLPELFTAPEWFIKIMTPLFLGQNHPVSSLEILQPDTDPTITGFHPVTLPGHHSGHMGFFNKQTKVLIAGDLIDPRYGMKPLLTSPSSDFKAMNESLDVVNKLSPKILIPGHGEPLIGTLVVKEAIKRAKNILDHAYHGVLEALSHESRTLAQLSTELRGYSLGPGDIHRRIFIHSILRYLLSQEKICKESSHPRKTKFFLNNGKSANR
ncbi:MAG: MBL fold metallo-hydrolase [Promethearchaeota archaeon]